MRAAYPMPHHIALHSRSFDLGSSVTGEIPSAAPVAPLDQRLLQAFSEHASQSAAYEARQAALVTVSDTDGDRLLKKQADAADRAVQIQLLSVITKKLLGIPETLLKG